jgi:hypothetical protein
MQHLVFNEYSLLTISYRHYSKTSCRLPPIKVRLLKMVKEVTAIVAAAAPNRGIGYQGQLVRP